MKLKTLLSALVFGALFAAPAYAAPLEMNFQSLYNPAQRQNADALEPWAKSFEEKSGGDMKMHFFYAGGLVEANAIYDSLKSGALDSAGWSTLDIKQTPYFYMCQLPYLTKNQQQAYNVFKKMYEEIPEMKADLDSAGVLLSMAASAPVAIASKDIKLRTPADLAGKRVLVAGGGAFAEYVEAWGGIPVVVAMGDVYIGLQRGMGEMFICGVSCVKGARVQEFCKYMTVTGQTFTTPFPYTMNRALFEEDMNDQQRALTLELSKDLGQNVITSFLADVQNTYKEFEAAGMEVYFPNEDEMKQWVDGAKSTIDKLWVRRLKDAGVANPEEWIKKYYDFSASVE
ncbi:MAG: TRAP transporter substrate-binding protein DctP [Mailhella sp.]|nr:TRAP transporter substrate-binding protein DctP [Mailhella sp.]